jgi:ABC-type microcin C transport system permease subunit YejE
VVVVGHLPILLVLLVVQVEVHQQQIKQAAQLVVQAILAVIHLWKDLREVVQMQILRRQAVVVAVQVQ